MKTITFHCETITPMFLAGADGTTPELRPPSIKGAMRFWWRAMNAGNYKTIGDLKKAESEIFGGTDEKSGRSKVILDISDKKTLKTESISLTPHHKNEFVNGMKDFKAIKRTGSFYEFNLIVRFDENVIIETTMLDLLKTTFWLGGLGKRARRGFGSISLRDYPFNEEDLNVIVAKYNNANGLQNYPYIISVTLGKKDNYRTLLEEIGSSSHSFTNNSLGFATQGRLSSPAYVSIVLNNENFQILITKLKTIYPGGAYGQMQKQLDFINSLI